ncbi:MAG: type II toxin-antitoxin system RelE/ParE family toxin [Reichenbachiella sp.]|uniref:type II toxin-antitoxin system RelE/ParE family toxin n=1 Tax=Reichenbachiella sp. TaxID=2184521 RepID=UPI002965D215|nr:type II toxin-antitoxin system RelE/ParE family toxin [Reichenbachiella sp.]MDW3208594.1 type II toxin-antitoxin system RelE/ParE family toxin [Reichenbachiella sp.]
MTVVFTFWAKSCLKSIHDYYLEVASQEKAVDIANQIIETTQSLNKFSKRGRLVEELQELGKDHRYILALHFKIIYRIEKDKIYTTDVFSTRQDPDSILKRNV